MCTTGGFIKLDRKMMECRFFEKRRTEDKWLWIEMLMRAEWQQVEHWTGADSVTVERGELLVTMGEMCKWCDPEMERGHLRRLLEAMIKAEMITTEAIGTGRYAKTLIRIENYETYQGTTPTAEPKKTRKKTTENQTGKTTKKTTMNTDAVLRVVRYWNDNAAPLGLSRITVKEGEPEPVGKAWMKCINRALKEYGEQRIYCVIKAIVLNDWNLGMNPTGWKADLEWALRDKQMLKYGQDIEPFATQTEETETDESAGWYE